MRTHGQPLTDLQRLDFYRDRDVMVIGNAVARKPTDADVTVFSPTPPDTPPSTPAAVSSGAVGVAEEGVVTEADTASSDCFLCAFQPSSRDDLEKHLLDMHGFKITSKVSGLRFVGVDLKL